MGVEGAFAAQPENEEYCNYAVDKFDLRGPCVSTPGSSLLSREPSATWKVRAEDGSIRCRYLMARAGCFRRRCTPIPGREDFGGEAYHTGLWPKTPVDFKGKRVAVIGTGASGVQIVPEIARSTSLTIYQRTPNWCTPLSNRPITPAEQDELKAGFEALRETDHHGRGFAHEPSGRLTFEDSKDERWAFYEKMWRSPGFSKLSSNYSDLLLDKAANAEFCEFISEKIRDIVKDPAVADKLIPKDHGFAGKRPRSSPRLLRDLQPAERVLGGPRGNADRAGDTDRDRDGRRGPRVRHDRVGHRFRLRHRPVARMGVRGRDGLALEEHWADGPATYLGLMSHGFPNLFFPGGPHAGSGNNPRYNGDQSDFIADAMEYADAHGYTTIEVPAGRMRPCGPR